MWSAARNALMQAEASILGLEAIATLARMPRERGVDATITLDAINAIVVALVEGFQGKIVAAELKLALTQLDLDLLGTMPIPAAIETFRSRL